MKHSVCGRAFCPRPLEADTENGLILDTGQGFVLVSAVRLVLAFNNINDNHTADTDYV